MKKELKEKWDEFWEITQHILTEGLTIIIFSFSVVALKYVQENWVYYRSFDKITNSTVWLLLTAGELFITGLIIMNMISEFVSHFIKILNKIKNKIYGNKRKMDDDF